jgi:hypothetical protein
MTFINKNNILNDAQNGFRKGKSTETVIHTFLENIQKAIDKKINVIGTFLDLSKEYDVLDHKILLLKLDAYGIRGLANLWFKSYLCSQKRYVEINHGESTNCLSEKFTSALKETKCGVLGVWFLAQFCFCYI